MKIKAHHVGAGEGKPVNRRKKGRTYSKETTQKISHSYPAIMPNHIITAFHIPWDCECKWDAELDGNGNFSHWRLKFYNMGCPVKAAGNHR